MLISYCLCALREKKHDIDSMHDIIINEYDKALISTPGGCANNEEMLEATAIREVKEEVGIHLKSEDLTVIAVTNSVTKSIGKNFVSYYYVATVPDNTDFYLKPVNEGGEVLDARWVTLDEIRSKDFKWNDKTFMPAYGHILSNDLTANGTKTVGSACITRIDVLENIIRTAVHK
jgi:ADP-ribose pyrophosphatase YjhB (NUDIX family)